jgi:hypothetical protein
VNKPVVLPELQRFYGRAIVIIITPVEMPISDINRVVIGRIYD